MGRGSGSNARLIVSLVIALLVAYDFVGYPIAADSAASTQAPTQFSARGALIGRTNAQQTLTLTVPLKVQDQAGLDAFLRDLYNPMSPHFHQYLTPQQFTGQFLSAASRTQVTDYLRTQGLTVSDPGVGTTLNATGTVAQVERAFSVTISNYREASGRVFYANDRSPALPPAIAQRIQGILGLDNAVEGQPQLVHGPTQATRRGNGNATPSGCTGAVNRANASGSYTPNEFSTAYNFDYLSTKGFHGENQTIALFEAANYLDANVSIYQTCFGTSVPLSRTLVDGGGALGGSGEQEVELDIDVVLGMAPKIAALHVYEGPNFLYQYPDQFQKIANDNSARVVSSSWGTCESSYTTAIENSLNTIFQQMATQGQSVLVAAGDSGSNGCPSSAGLAVQTPGSQPYVTAVGGTTLNLGTGNNYSSEATWNDYSTTGGAGGGGLSAVWAKPTYQNSPGTSNTYSNGKRQVPDVSANGDGNTGYTVYVHDTVNCPAATGTPGATDCWEAFGGTSAAAPLWASAITRANQLLFSVSKTAVGFANPTLYAMANGRPNAAVFHDITRGDNCYAAFCGRPNSGTATYPATAGYDQATGIGSLNAGNLALYILGKATFSSSTLAFGAQPVNFPESQTLTLTNDGIATLAISAVALTDTTGTFSTSYDTCSGHALNPGGACSVVVTFQPAAAQSYSSSLTFTDSGGDSPQHVQLTGSGSLSTVALTPNTLAFGNQVVGTAQTQTVTLRNTGATALGISSTGLTGTAFTVANDQCTSNTLQPSQTCTVTIRFQPASATSYAESFLFEDNAPDSPQTVSLTGAGITAAITLSPTSVAFGAQSVGTAQTRIVTFNNQAAMSVTMGTVTLPAPGGGFTLAGDSCSGQTINGGSSCNVTVRFQPLAAQSYSATLSFADNGIGSPQQATITGSGITTGGPALALSPNSVNFGNTPMGTSYNSFEALQVTNSGSSQLSISSLTLAGANLDDYHISDYHCQYAALAPGDYCVVYLYFHPGASGSRTATLNIYSNASSDPSVPTTVALSGSGFAGSAPLVDLRGDLTDFGSQNTGATSAPMNINLLNSGNAPLSISGVTVAGNSVNGGDFSVDASGCTSAPVQAGNQCPVAVRFRPGAAGIRKAILIVNDSAADTPQLAFVQGTGVVPNTPAVSLSPQTIAFGNQVQNTASGAVPVTLQNTGAAALSISSIVMTGDFAQTNNCGTSVAAGASCTINVTFTPTQQNFRSGSVTITDNAPGGQQVVTLSGTGVAPGSGTVYWDYSLFQQANFGNVQVGGFAIITMTVHNLGTGTMQLISCTLGGTNPQDFAVNNGCDGNTVGPGQYHDIPVQADPYALGTRTATVTLRTNDTNSSGVHTATLTANGIGNPVVSLPTSLDMGNQPVTTTGGAHMVTLKNTGNAPLSITSVTTSGEFTQTNDCGTSVQGFSATCTISVHFAPTQLGQRTGTLTIADNAAGSPHTVNLSGTGTPPPPRITRLSTLSVPTAGGTPVTITGTGFQVGLSVFFGGVAGTVVGTPTETTLVVTTPAHAMGTVDVEVANPDGQYSDAFSGFSFIPPGGVGPPPPQPTAPPASGTPVPLPVGARPTGSPVPGATPIPIPLNR